MAPAKKRELMGIFLISLFLSACVPAEVVEPSIPPIALTEEQNDGDTNSQPPPVEPATKINSDLDASRFLSLATFGGSKSEIADLVGRDAADWLVLEFSKPINLTLPAVEAQMNQTGGGIPQNFVDAAYWDHIIGSNDQLRQRMAFALSQILVYSDDIKSDQVLRAHYQDILIRNAFGNYRDVLEEVTYSPAMGQWLTYLGNRKADPTTGRMPDENYAREILQLFSIGLVELNMDGSTKLDALGQQIETYTNEDIEGLARVFTGLSWAGGEFFRQNEGDNTRPMIMYPEHHSEATKTFLGTTIAEGTTGDESIQIALNEIFDHPNLAPFISRLLIQRFTQSDPSPEYIESVALAFDNGEYTAERGQKFGTGERGDLSATLAAILLHPSLFAKSEDDLTMATGKVREPILRFAHWARAFNVSGLNAFNELKLSDTSGTDNSLGQQAFSSPSVFNFYRPGYVAPGTNAGDANITVPEFQIINETSSVGYLNFMTEFAFDRARQRDSSIVTYHPDYSDEVALVDDPMALVEHLDTLLTAGRMTNSQKADIAEIAQILRTIEVHPKTAAEIAVHNEKIVKTTISLVLNSPAYAVVY